MATVTGTKRHLGITSNTFDSNGDVVVGGNLTINGTTTTLDTANLLVEDKNIIIGNVSTPSDTTADGGGITLKGASDYTINWVNANDRWEFNQGIYSSGPITSAGQITGTELEGTSLDINGTGDFTGKVNFQGDAAIEGGSGYGVFKGYTANDNHFISVRGAVANTSTLTITGGHQTTFVEHADAADEGWYFKSFTTGTYREIARIDGLNEMYLGGNQVYHEGHLPTLTELGAAANTVVNQTDFVSAANGGTFSGPIIITDTLSSPSDILTLYNETTTNGITIKFSDQAPTSTQFGRITFYHQDTKSYGSGAAFIIGSDQTNTTILADGKLMYNEGIYSKPATGTGAGTRKDSNWDDAYTHSTSTHAPTDAEANVQADWSATSGDALILNKPTIPPDYGAHNGVYLKTNYRANWIRLGYGNSGGVRYHKLATLVVPSSYVDYNATFDWTGRYASGTAGIHLHSDGNTTAVVYGAWYEDFNPTKTLEGTNGWIKYTISGDTVEIWVKTSGWREFDYILKDSVNEASPTLTWYDENTTTDQSTEPSNLNAFTNRTHTAAGYSTATGVADNAEQNVQSDWNATSGDALILNKPSIPSDFVSAANGGTFSGGITIGGSVDSGATNMGYYESVGTNLILKGDSNGRSGIFFESEKDGTNINDPSDYGFIQFHSYGYGNTSGEANNLVIGVSNDSTDKLILQAPYNGGVMIGYKDATSGTGLTLSEVIHSNASSYNNGNWDSAYDHSQDAHAPANAEQNVQSDWNATSGDALILNKPSIPAASGKGQNVDYIASNLPSTNSSYRDNFGAGVWAYSGYSTGANRPFTYDATLQIMPTANLGFELSTAWHSTGEGSLKIRALRDCCEGWGDYHDIWTSDNFANNSANWNTAHGWGNHADAGYLDSDSNYLKSNAADTFTGQLSVGSTDTRRAGIYGIYDSFKIGHIWSMGTAYMIPSNGSDFGNLYGFAYKHTNNTTGGTMGGGHQAVWCTGGTPRASIGESGIWTTGNVTHSGLTMTDGTDIDQIKTYTKSLTLTTSWIDTGVNGSELATGTYIIQVFVNNSGANGQQYSEMYSGTMSWYADNTNSTNHDEIVLHAAGHARNDKSIYLRVLRTVSADANDLKLQISNNRNATATASNYIFKFRRMI